MKRFLIFTLLYPPLALAVFTAPDGFKSLLDWLGYAYLLAMIPAWLTAAVDWKLSANRTMRTIFAGAVITGSIALFLGGYAGFWPALMTMLVGAIPAGVCSWLSREKQNGAVKA
jgi:CHASE2 domain-containing sensor protein